MHRKQATFFGKLHPKFDPPSYLTKFSLFNQQVDLKKLKHTMQIQGFDKNDPIVYEFVNDLCQKMQKNDISKINFQEYLGAIDKKMTPIHQQSSVLFKLLVKGSDIINIKQFKQIVNEIGEKQLTSEQTQQLMIWIVGKNTSEISLEQFNQILHKRVHFYGI